MHIHTCRSLDHLCYVYTYIYMYMWRLCERKNKDDWESYNNKINDLILAQLLYIILTIITSQRHRTGTSVTFESVHVFAFQNNHDSSRSREPSMRRILLHTFRISRTITRLHMGVRASGRHFSTWRIYRMWDRRCRPPRR